MGTIESSFLEACTCACDQREIESNQSRNPKVLVPGMQKVQRSFHDAEETTVGASEVQSSQPKKLSDRQQSFTDDASSPSVKDRARRSSICCEGWTESQIKDLKMMVDMVAAEMSLKAPGFNELQEMKKEQYNDQQFASGVHITPSAVVRSPYDSKFWSRVALLSPPRTAEECRGVFMSLDIDLARFSASSKQQPTSRSARNLPLTGSSRRLSVN